VFSGYRRAYVSRLKVLARRFNHQLELSGRTSTDRQVHDLRVTVRRIRSAMRLIKDDSGGKNLESLDAKLKKLGRTLGKRRELDVALGDAHSMHLDDRYLRKVRKKACTRVSQSLVRHRRKKLIRSLKSNLNELGLRPNLNLTDSLSELRRTLLPWLDAPIQRKKEIHAFRIVMKRSRYILETLGVSVEPLEQLQDHLGRAHDMEILTKLTGPSVSARKLKK
jgi:CHAD domain-containing protein